MFLQGRNQPLLSRPPPIAPSAFPRNNAFRERAVPRRLGLPSESANGDCGGVSISWSSAIATRYHVKSEYYGRLVRALDLGEDGGVKMPLAWREKERNTASVSLPQTALGNNPPVAEPWVGQCPIASGHPTIVPVFAMPFLSDVYTTTAEYLLYRMPSKYRF